MQMRLGFTAALILGLGCVRYAPPAPPSDSGLGAAERSVYATVVGHALRDSGHVVLEAQTLTYAPLPPESWLLHRKDPVPEPLSSTLARLSAAPRRLAPGEVIARAEVLPQNVARRRAAAARGGLQVLAVTPVAFTPDSSQALVYYEVRCGDLCGWGVELWLTRESGQWRVRQEVAHWMS